MQGQYNEQMLKLFQFIPDYPVVRTSIQGLDKNGPANHSVPTLYSAVNRLLIYSIYALNPDRKGRSTHPL